VDLNFIVKLSVRLIAARMEEREFRSPSRNLGSPMARSVSGLSNVMTGAMTQNDEVYRLRKQVSSSLVTIEIVTH
jgi:hypothetical protein